MPDPVHLEQFYARNASLGDSPRQRRMAWYESFFRCSEYESCGYDFNGRSLAKGASSGSTLSSAGMPEGYVDWAEKGADSVPYQLRKPTAPSRLVRTVVSRFTGSLFSEHKRPSIRWVGDPDTEDYLEGIVQAGQLWSVMEEVRNFGGAQGTGVIGFGFRGGVPVFESFDAKYCLPTWEDRSRQLLRALDVTYRYPVEERTRKGWRTFWYWYRRRIDTTHDTVYEPIEVRPGVIPGSPQYPWVPANWTRHDFGEVPLEWIQNTRCSDGIDGDPDCEGQYDAIREMDTERSLAGEGIKPNCDPTLYVATEKQLQSVKKGSRNALHIAPGDTAGYLEMTGSGSVVARENAEALKSSILEAVACVIETGAASATTATEIRHRYRAMFDRVDVFRQQYGEGVRRLLEKVERAARKLTTPGSAEPPAPRIPAVGSGEPTAPDLPVSDEGDEEEPVGERPTVRRLVLPPKIVEDPDDPTVPATVEERKLGTGRGILQIVWPEHVIPTPDEVETYTRALAAQEAAGYIDGETAAKLLGTFTGLQDAAVVYRKAQLAKKEQRESEEAAIAQALLGPQPQPGQPVQGGLPGGGESA